jgi:hypothetical protein
LIGKRKALIDLPSLQSVLKSEKFNIDSIWAATDRCEWSMENEGWTNENVLQILINLTVNDYVKSEWCQIKGGSMVPSDVYLMPFDPIRQVRSVKGLEVYTKFSIEVDGTFTLVLVSCHPPT